MTFRPKYIALALVARPPHTMPPALRKTAVLTNRPCVIETYPSPPGAPMPQEPSLPANYS
jgi:hypothetical protein